MHNAVSVFRASTSEAKGREGMEAFREQFSRTILRLEMTPIGDQPLECDVTIRRLPELALATGTLSPMSNHHPAELGDDSVVLAALQDGTAEFRQGRRETLVETGQAILTDSSAAGVFTGHTATRLANFRLERHVLAMHMADPWAALARPIAAGNYALRLLLGYSGVLADPELAIDPEACRTVSASIYDLAILAIGGATDERAHAGGVGAARLRAIKADVQKNLASPTLSIAGAARRHGISASYVRRLFAANGTSFSDYLLFQRLKRAHRLLTDPWMAHRTISSIAYEVGFGDLSYFNRTFRRRFGMTPSEVRGD